MIQCYGPITMSKLKCNEKIKWISLLIQTHSNLCTWFIYPCVSCSAVTDCTFTYCTIQRYANGANTQWGLFLEKKKKRACDHGHVCLEAVGVSAVNDWTNRLKPNTFCDTFVKQISLGNTAKENTWDAEILYIVCFFSQEKLFSVVLKKEEKKTEAELLICFFCQMTFSHCILLDCLWDCCETEQGIEWL